MDIKDKNKVLRYLDRLKTDETTVAELDIIKYLKGLVKGDIALENKEEKKAQIDIKPYFDKLWAYYPRKDAKLSAFKMFEHKVRGYDEETLKAKCNLIFAKQKKYVLWVNENEVEMRFVKLYASWLNAEIEDSKYYRLKR